jgi:hypothetical protein
MLGNRGTPKIAFTERSNIMLTIAELPCLKDQEQQRAVRNQSLDLRLQAISNTVGDTYLPLALALRQLQRQDRFQEPQTKKGVSNIS